MTGAILCHNLQQLGADNGALFFKRIHLAEGEGTTEARRAERDPCFKQVEYRAVGGARFRGKEGAGRMPALQT
jgi:hypothetical protein